MYEYQEREGMVFRLFPIVIIELFLSACALRSPPPIPMPIESKTGQVAGSTAVGSALLGKFFVDGLDEFV